MRNLLYLFLVVVIVTCIGFALPNGDSNPRETVYPTIAEAPEFTALGNCDWPEFDGHPWQDPNVCDNPPAGPYCPPTAPELDKTCFDNAKEAYFDECDDINSEATSVWINAWNAASDALWDCNGESYCEEAVCIAFNITEGQIIDDYNAAMSAAASDFYDKVAECCEEE